MAQGDWKMPRIASMSQRLSRRQAIRAISLACSAAALSQAAMAQTWPDRPITFIVSQPAGASPDIMARLVGDRLAQILKQPVIVDNKPGGGNTVGAHAAARSAPDGTKFFFATSASLVTNPFLMKSVPYDPIKDFVPIALIARSHQIVAVNPELPIKSLADLIAYDKKEPGKLSMAADGPRNLSGVIALALNKRAGMSLVQVSYPNPTQGLRDVAAGNVGVGVFSVSTVDAFVKDGRLRIIADSSKERSSTLPNVPLVADTLPGFDFLGWFMLMAPAGTPPEIIAQMSAALDTVARDPKVQEVAPTLGFEVNPKGLGGPEAAAKYLGEQMNLWRTTTQELGIEAQ
jgi:tripartite-type tricarboxylate transporter receptor subunit TctC